MLKFFLVLNCISTLTADNYSKSMILIYFIYDLIDMLFIISLKIQTMYSLPIKKNYKIFEMLFLKILNL